MVREPSGGRAELVGARLMARLTMHVQARGLGRTFQSSQGFLLTRDPDWLLAPDGSFVSRERLATVPERGFIPLAPDFALEIRSPADSWEAVVEKGTAWLVHGTNVVWVIDPLERRAAVLRPGEPPEVLRSDGTLDATPAVPGFTIPLRDVLEDAQAP